jgi:pimeloyl-ACP methyl ester carboxylesterase
MRNGQSLIILHGWQSSKEKWSKVKEVIEREGVKVIIPDLPGFKEKNKLERAWNIDNYVNWFKDFSHDKEKFFLLGHSFGGRVSIKFASKHPERLEGLILVSSAGIKNQERPISKLIPLLKKFSFLPGYSFLRKAFYKFIIRKTDYLYVDGMLKETFKKVIEEDLTPILSQIKARTLILWGQKDKITPLANARLMKERIGESRLEVLEGIGHTPYLEDPEGLAEKILTFIK